jgi:hypothetical protein
MSGSLFEDDERPAPFLRRLVPLADRPGRKRWTIVGQGHLPIPVSRCEQ